MLRRYAPRNDAREPASLPAPLGSALWQPTAIIAVSQRVIAAPDRRPCRGVPRHCEDSEAIHAGRIRRRSAARRERRRVAGPGRRATGRLGLPDPPPCPIVGTGARGIGPRGFRATPTRTASGSIDGRNRRRDPQTPPSGRGQAAGRAPSQGPAGRRPGARRGARAARRPAAPARPADRAPAPDPGPLRPSLGRASRRAGRGDAPRPDRGLRGRDLLRPLRRGQGGRDAAAAADRPGLRQPDLRADRARRRCWRRCATGSIPTAVRVVRGALHGPLRHRAGRRGRAALRRATRPPTRCARPCARGRRPRRRCPSRSTSTRYVADGGYQLLRRIRRAGRGEPRADRRPRAARGARTIPACAASAAPASRPGASGSSSARQPKPRYLAVNADEGEPGTFKDRYYLERDPHRFLEGVLIAAWSIEADGAYIYLRDEYPAIREILLREIAASSRRQGIAPAGLSRAAPRRRRLHLRRGIGDDREHRGQARPARATARPTPPRSACSAGRP